MSFLPQFHFVPASDKLKPEWASSAINYYWFQNFCRNLLEGKNVAEIDGYADGNYSLAPFRTMYRSERAKMLAEQDINISKEAVRMLDKIGFQVTRVALIPPKLNSGIATQQKIPIEILATCLDALAQKKKEEDLDFLRNKKEMENVIQPLYDSMNLGKADMGTTKHSSVPFTGMPMDLDIEDDEEFRLFANMIYNLAPESAIETILQAFAEIKKIIQIRFLETRDQYKYGVSVHDTFDDKNTGLPNVEYVHPSDMWTDWSALPDYSDNLIRVRRFRVTPMQLFKYFPDEICDEQFLEKIVNYSGTRGEWGVGYTCCNSDNRVHKDSWGTYKMNLMKVQIKSVDNAMIAKKQKSGYKYFTNDESKCSGRIWGENTYTFYWLQNTKWFFGIDRLGFAHRTKGSEIYTSFGYNIYKSQEISAVEHCIGENIKAQMADIKLQHEIIMASPPGKIIDIKYIRNVIEGLTDEMNKYTVKDILDKGFEGNVWTIDTEGFENKNGQGQFLPVRDLPGGLKDSILGYYRVRAEAERNIAGYLSINEQLTGQSATPEGLVGTQKLLLSYSINGLYYITEAIQSQYQSLFTTWAYYIQQAIKKGGAAKKAIENIIGSRKVDILKGLNEIPLHQIGIIIRLSQREEERAKNEERVNFLYTNGVLNMADVYEIQNTVNPKDSAWLIAVKQNRWEKKQERLKMAQMQSNERMIQQQGQNMLANTQTQTQGKIQEIEAEVQGEGELMTLSDQLGLGKEYRQGMMKRLLQKERLQGQTEKSLKTIYANQQAKQQEAFQ